MSVIKLSAFAIPKKYTGGWTHHTYVAGSNGVVWPCFGRSEGGRELVSGYGTLSKANCYSMHDSQAGIFYSVTGVCHQAANRVLYETGQHVGMAEYFMSASVVYGHWGLDWDEEGFGQAKPSWVENWSDRLLRCHNGGDPSDFPKPPGGYWRHISVRKGLQAKKLVGKLAAVVDDSRRSKQNSSMSHQEIVGQLRSEVETLAKSRVNPKDVRREVPIIVDSAVGIYEKRCQLVNEFLKGKATTRELIEETNRIVEDGFASLRSNIKSGVFADLFGAYSRIKSQVADIDAEIPGNQSLAPT